MHVLQSNSLEHTVDLIIKTVLTAVDEKKTASQKEFFRREEDALVSSQMALGVFTKLFQQLDINPLDSERLSFQFGTFARFISADDDTLTSLLTDFEYDTIYKLKQILFDSVI